MNSFELALKTKQLPTKIDELVPLSFIGATAVKFYKDKIKLFDNLGISEDQRVKTLKDGQDAGILLLEIERRIGELLPEDSNKERDKKRSRLPQGNARQYGTGVKGLPDGIDSIKASKARQIKNHPKEVEETIQEAIDNDDIPTKTAVLNKIRFKKEKARREKAEANKTESKLIMRLEEQDYLNTLEWIISKLPQQPPKNWSEPFLKQARGYANIIINRLEVFKDE